MALISDAGMSMLATRVAELVRLGLLHLDRAFADDRPLVPAGARRLQLREDLRPAAATWNRRYAFGVSLKAACLPAPAPAARPCSRR